MTETCDERVDVYVPPKLRAEIEAQLDYGDSLSGWMRDAAEQRLNDTHER